MTGFHPWRIFAHGGFPPMANCLLRDLHLRLILTLYMADPAADAAASTTPASVVVRVMPSMYASSAMPVLHMITATIWRTNKAVNVLAREVLVIYT